MNYEVFLNHLQGIITVLAATLQQTIASKIDQKHFIDVNSEISGKLMFNQPNWSQIFQLLKTQR